MSDRIPSRLVGRVRQSAGEFCEYREAKKRCTIRDQLGRSGYANGMKRNATTLDRLVEPLVRTLTPEVARSLIQLRADPELQARMDELAEKCNEGRLTPEEREEYETSIRFANYLAIIQAKARRLLKVPERS
jgi:hypothetical protein